MSGILPVVLGPDGMIPSAPAVLHQQLLDAVALLSPGYEGRLPGSLVEDITSTDVGALVICDQARVEVVNSLTPRGANAFLLNQLGQIYGIFPGLPTNTSAFVVFSGTIGYVIAKGFTVSDGQNQYILPDGGVIGAGNISLPLLAVSTTLGPFAVPPNTVTTLVTSVPGTVTLSVTNPLAGTPATDAETESAYRVRVLQAGLVAAQGMPRLVRTALAAVPGVIARLISVRAMGTAWEVICGGSGDPYQIGYAIFTSLFDITTLVGSTIHVTGITQANPGVVTTDLNHGYVTGQTGVQINGALGMTAVNGVNYTITVIDQKHFSIGVNTTGFGAWTSGGVVTPNFRNISVNISDYPDTYTVPFVTPPLQTVTMNVTWNTSSPNFVSPLGVAQLSQPALADYINSIAVGFPINLYQLEVTFRNAITVILSPDLLTRMVFSVSINGVVTTPAVGTGIIAGDPESFFSIVLTDIIVNQG